MKTRIFAVLFILAGIGIGYYDFHSQPFQFGLDISGGSHLVYTADVSSVPTGEVDDAMDTLRDVIERRVNLFGVAEPIVQTEKTSVLAGSEESGQYRLIVELPGVTDVDSAVKMIGETPVLEFMTMRSQAEIDRYNKAVDAAREAATTGKTVSAEDQKILQDGPYQPTELTGRFLSKATLEFDQTTRAPYISLQFNDQGADLFAKITKENVGKPVAIYLDRNLGNYTPITEPVVQAEITGGKAVITGSFTADEAKTLVGRLNSGALPVDKLQLIGSQTIGPSLGAQALNAGIKAGIWGTIIAALFLILWYRLQGVIAALALAIYVVIMLALFKLIPVTLTAAGIAGFILSIGLAVDANVLIFERTKEELRSGKTIIDAIKEGFSRAWPSIRDSNISSLISAVILFWFGTSLFEGFALTFGIGILVSMFSAITISRTFLLAIARNTNTGLARTLFGSGFSK
jgi:protein-export membrane protein SecD